jgi:hypothetical protein
LVAETACIASAADGDATEGHRPIYVVHLFLYLNVTLSRRIASYDHVVRGYRRLFVPMVVGYIVGGSITARPRQRSRAPDVKRGPRIYRISFPRTTAADAADAGGFVRFSSCGRTRPVCDRRSKQAAKQKKVFNDEDYVWLGIRRLSRLQRKNACLQPAVCDSKVL